MVAVAPLAFLEESTSSRGVDERIVLHDVTWDRYEALLSFLGDDFPSVRVTYLEGVLELLSPSQSHEDIKKMFGRLVEAYAMETRLDLNGHGSTTFRKRAKRRGVEPDECYSVGPLGKVPDLVFEVIWTNGEIDKLDVYAGLGVPEVWMREEGVLTIHALGARGYRRVKRSRILPELAPAQLVRYLERTDQTKAALEFVDFLRKKRR